MRKRKVLNSPRILELKKEKRRIVFNKILIFWIGFLAVFFLIAYLSNLKKVNIAEIQINGNSIVDTEAIKGTVLEKIRGKYLWLFPKTNIFFYPQNTVKNELQNKFKRLKDVNLSIKNNKILEIALTERTAKYTWCGESPEALLPSEGGSKASGKDQKCYFLDDDGYVIDEAPYFSGDIYFKFYGLISGYPDSAASPLGLYFFKKNFKQLSSFKDTFISIGLKPVALYATKDGEVEMFLSKGIKSANEPKIIFKMNADFQKIMENLQAALNTEPLKSKFKNKYGALQYIDLRFGNKVYDKFQ